MSTRRRWILSIAIAVAAIAAYLIVPTIKRREATLPPKPEAPPDLARLRGAFEYGLDALRRGAGDEAVRYLRSFNFGHRAVEQYRLYFLANAWQAAGNTAAARVTLARLWNTAPRLVYWETAGFNLGGLHEAAGDWLNAGDVYRVMAVRSDHPPVAGAARWNAVVTRFDEGDIAAAYQNARELTVKDPRTPQSIDGIAVLRSLSSLGPADALALTAEERLERAVCLLRDGDPQNAFNELSAMTTVPVDLRVPVQLNRGLALNQLHRYQDSNALLDPLSSGAYRFAIPAIYHAWKNYSALAASINPVSIRTFVVKKRVGSKYVNVRQSRQLVDTSKKKKKDNYENLARERLQDLLTLPIADPIRVEVLNNLIEIAEAHKEDSYEQELVAELAKINPSEEAGLQHFWDQGWNAYTRGDLREAIDNFDFILETYRNTNVNRQAEYWRARSMERLGEKEEAEAVYRRLAAAPYDDLYAIFSEVHGAPHRDPSTNPLTAPRPDWPEIAEQNMPRELRLAYELTALDDARDARLEIQRNVNRSNQTYAEALLADLYHSSADTELMMRSLKRAFPQIATVDQDSVPAYFLTMYYPVRYRDMIENYARQNAVDPFMVMALIHQESDFNPKARSPAGAAGLMQMMPPTARELARMLRSSADVENPEIAIRLGTLYFRQLIDRFNGAVQLAVASYNAGLGNVQRWRRAAPHKPLDEFLESMPFAETRTYVKRVTIIRASYRRMAR